MIFRQNSRAHLQKTLGEYRFLRVVEEKAGERYVYEYAHATDPKRRIRAVWSPTGNGRTAKYALRDLPGRILRAERMPLKAGETEKIPLPAQGKGQTLPIDESPLYLTIQLP